MKPPSAFPYRLPLVAALALALAACVTDARLSGSSESGFLASAKAISTNLSPADRKPFDAAVARYVATYFADTRPADAPPSVPDPSAVHRMSAPEFIAFVDRVLVLHKPADLPPMFPNPLFADQLLQQHEYQRLLLTEARQRIVENGMNTIDDYPIDEAILIPPQDDVPITMDKVRIVIRLRNASAFDAYDPQFYVAITRGADPNAVYEAIVRPDKNTKKEPIGPGMTVEYEVACCDLIGDPVRNAELKLHQEELDLDVSLVAMKDHRNTDILNLDGYDRFDVAALPRIDACIESIRSAPATWAPTSVADGGDPCLGTSMQNRSSAAIDTIVEHTAKKANKS